MSRENSALAVAKANSVSISLADTCEVDRIAILEEFANLTVGQLNLFLTAPAQLQHGTVLSLLGATDGASAEDIS